jgi:prolyl-tRNA editing enzyme YbaK/EbsC (Cys-tRNA(Pro) deacylase)
MPPVGSLYNLDVYVDESLADDEEIVFNAGRIATQFACGMKTSFV